MTKESANNLPSNYRYNGIDIVKFMCALLVCIIHITPFRTESFGLDHLNFWLKNCWCRIAVPFYFTASGFLLFRKIELKRINGSRIKQYCFKIMRLLGTWSFLLFAGGSVQLWYLGALVLAVMIISFFIKKGVSVKWMVLTSVVLYFLGLLGDSYYGFIEPLKRFFIPKLLIVGYDTVFSTTRNGVFFALVFVLMGVLYAKKNIVVNGVFAGAGLIISLLMMFLEVYLLRHYSHPKDYNMFIALLPAVFFLFYFASHVELKNRPVYGRLRVIGVIVFFSHLLVNYFVGLAIEIANKKTGLDLSAFHFIITMILLIMLSVVIERLSRTNKYRWLKYLFS